MFLSRIKKTWWFVVGIIVAIPVIFTVYAELTIRAAAAGKLYNDVAAIPPKQVALVLGCAPKMSDGQDNFFFTARIEAAAQLFFAGKAQFLLVSGDNGTVEYDEPTAMRAALIAAGVPAEKIFLDYAGFRTLDSILRARKVFQETDVIIISQRFHLERALYLAEKTQLTAAGFCAPTPPTELWTPYIRETLARANAVWDIWIGKEPKFLGEVIEIK